MSYPQNPFDRERLGSTIVAAWKGTYMINMDGEVGSAELVQVQSVYEGK